MRKIHQLPEQVVSKIAAGEVIERPVFAVKELIENAIDSGATSIQVHIEESGLKKITVIDNGEGMSGEDLQESFKPHTTSKITKADELSHIKTLGFRGEALASIAAISRLTIRSKVTKAAVGNQVIIKNGKFEKISPVGMPAGTSVTIDYLFHSLPVRKKFLGTPRTEFRHILDLLSRYALSYPQIHFVLTHNKKSLLDLPATKDILSRIEKLLGKDIVSSLVPVAYSDSYVTLSGFLAKPSITTRTPNKQFLFINNRTISDKSISLTIKSAFGTLLPSTVYPVCLLFVSLPFEMVDVNVHPRKEYVRFVDAVLLQNTIKQAIALTLARYDMTPSASFESLFLSDATGSTQSYAGRLLKESKMPWELPKEKIDYGTVMQLHKLYLLLLSNNGFVLIDQHAAHERVLYEQLLTEFAKEKKKHNLFYFPKPGVFDLSLTESELLLEHLENFHKLGWDIEQFNNTKFILRSLPVLFQDRDYLKLLREMLEDMREDGLQKNIDDVSRRMIAYLACRGAVKAGDELTKKAGKDIGRAT